MTKIFIKMILLLGVLLAVPYYMMGGEIPGFMSGLMPGPGPAKPKGIKSIGNAVTDTEVTVYQWVDDKGVKHFSNTPPANKEAKALHLRPNTNLVKSVEPPPEKKQLRPKAAPPLNPYTPGGAKKLMEDAKNVQEMLNQRFEQQQEALKNIR